MRTAFCILIAAVTLSFSAVAEPAGRVMLGVTEQAKWSGVGRVNLGDGFCTGTLVAPDLVVTAAHCLIATATGADRLAERVHFVAGYRMRKYEGHSRAAKIVLHPGYRHRRPADGESISKDLALVHLKTALDGVIPFGLTPGVDVSDEVTILSYARDRPEIPSIQSPCAVEARVGAIAVLDCDATKGVSGAPVFRMIDGEWRIAAVVSAIGQYNGAQKTFAVVLEDSLGPVLAAP
ncbi:MAG: trypsin-like serine protease [Pseudomonadota bacterium]